MQMLTTYIERPFLCPVVIYVVPARCRVKVALRHTHHIATSDIVYRWTSDQAQAIGKEGKTKVFVTFSDRKKKGYIKPISCP